jgi:hypothetical protein
MKTANNNVVTARSAAVNAVVLAGVVMWLDVASWHHR